MIIRFFIAAGENIKRIRNIRGITQKELGIVLIFNEDNERQKEIGEYLKSQKRCKTALITELVYAWLHKENKGVLNV